MHAQKRIFWSRQVIEFFIQLYKQNECLYNTMHKNFYNQRRKTEACECILQKMQKFLPELQIEDIHTKIKAIHDQMTNEATLIEESDASGGNYVPKLWCFDQLKFLLNHITSSTKDVEKNLDMDDETYVNDNYVHIESDSSNSLLSELTPNKVPCKFNWTRDITSIFIKLFKRYPVLYDRNHKNYRNRTERDEAQNKLLEDVKSYDSAIGIDDVIVKIRNLRTQFSKELRRMHAAKENNTTYEPKLWCFDELSYLNDRDIGIKPSHDYYNDEEAEENTCYNESLDDEQMHQMIVEDEVEYDETAFKSENHAIIEIVPNANSTDLTDEYEQVNQTPLSKKPRYEETVVNNENESKPSIPTESNKTATKRKAPTASRDGKYEWLGELVIAQMDEISETYRSDFAWDVQCLIRKYIIKTKEERNLENNSSSSKGAVKEKSSQDLVLPRSSNVSLNISFL